MPPLLMPPDPERTRRLRSANRSTLYLTQHMDELIEEHGGEWVVLNDGGFVTAHKDAKTAIRRARELGLDVAECLVQYLPKKGQLYFY